MNKFSEERVNELISKYNVTLISTSYVISTTVFYVRCDICGFVFPARLQHPISCQNCKKDNLFKDKIDLLKMKGFTYLSGNYVNQLSPILVRCDSCKREFISPLKFLFRGGCARCAKKEKLNIDELKARTVSSMLTLLSSEYVNSYSKLEWLCKKCGNVFWMNWDNIREGHGCPECSKMTGEKNYRWRGGVIPFYPSEFNYELKELIRNRDGRTCQYPNCTYDDTKQVKKLHVHHIDRNKQNSSPYNLISLCSIHHKMIEDVEEWRNYFYSITSDYEYRG